MATFLLSAWGMGRSAAARSVPLACRHAPCACVRLTGHKGAQNLKLEVAASEHQRQRGLMHRTTLEGIDGMLFVFPSEEEHIFWMHQTPLSLDMLFFDARGKASGWLERVPPNNDSPRTVHRPSRYVIELKAGAARALGLTPPQAHLVLDSAWSTP